MAIKPILFNTEMVKAILEWRKKQTRRIVKGVEGLNVYRAEPSEDAYETLHQWDFLHGFSDSGTYYEAFETINAPYAIGDILWVRETWCDPAPENPYTPFLYKADMPQLIHAEDTAHGEPVHIKSEDFKWIPSIHMPKEAARIFLRVKYVSAERLKDIHEKYEPGPDNPVVKEGLRYLSDFIAVWDSTIKPADRDRYGWEANPWVWVIEFEQCAKPEGWCAS